MNFATFKGTEESVIHQLTNPSPELIQALVEGHGLPGHQVNHPGEYTQSQLLPLYKNLIFFWYTSDMSFLREKIINKYSIFLSVIMSLSGKKVKSVLQRKRSM